MSTNEERLEIWRKNKNLWGRLPDSNVIEDKNVLQAVIGYVLRQLGRGNVPNHDLVMDTLAGVRPVPYCGMIGCFMITAEDHKDWTH